MFKRLAIAMPMMVLFFPLPARADMEDCLNRSIQISLNKFPIESTQHQATVTHNGLRYHWFNVYTKDTQNPLGEAIIAESSSVCELALFDVSGNIRDYDPYLGSEVVEKFKKEFAR